MQQHEQLQFLRALGTFVTQQVAAATAPLLVKISELEDKISELDAGDVNVITSVAERLEQHTKDISKHLQAEFDTRAAGLVTAAVEAARVFIPEAIVGPPGKDGQDGTSVDMEALVEKLHQFVEANVVKYFRANPVKNGKDGQDGKSVSLDDVLSGVRGLVAESVAAIPIPRSVVGVVIDRDGDLCVVLNDGESKKLGKVVGNDGLPGKDGKDGLPGKDGKDGSDGKDGLGFKDMSVTFDGERSFVFKFALEDRIEELSLTIPFMIYQGIWKAGSYSRGDCVTRDGSLFVARDDTDKQPGTVDSGWQLAAKRGRDGKDGDKGDQGERGQPGRNGQDLTQIGPDGKKWG